MTEHLNDNAARMALNAKGHRHDATLDRLADELEADPTAWQRLPRGVLSTVELYRDMRGHHRRAVAAGVITDTTKES